MSSAASCRTCSRRGSPTTPCDSGRSDEYFLDLAASALRSALLDAGLRDERLHFELFDGGHRGLGERYPSSFDYLVRSLSITF
jgi:hypothetical protein